MRIDFQSPVTGARNVVAGNTDLTMSRSDGARALRPVRPAQLTGRTAAVSRMRRRMSADAARRDQDDEAVESKECSMPRPTSPAVWASPLRRGVGTCSRRQLFASAAIAASRVGW